MLSSAALLGTLLLTAPEGAVDPRLSLVEEQLAGDTEQALDDTRNLIAADPELARELWLDYLRGDLLERLGHLEEANGEFAGLLSADPALAAYGRLRMASLQEAMGHPEVAAGLVATLLGSGAPADLAPRATELLVRALGSGADCRLLGRLDAWQVADAERRTLRLALADCTMQAGDIEAAGSILAELLEQETADLVGRKAAHALSRLPTPLLDLPEVQIAIGLAFHHNREFARAVKHLESGLAGLDPERLSINPDALDEYRYATARGYFWLQDYDRAVALFRELANTVDRDEAAARALYQEARCHELVGDWGRAAEAFRESFQAQPEGDWSAAALFSALRIAFRTGREDSALELFSILDSRPSWREVARRAALFLASSDLERGRGDRAGSWLQRGPGKHDVEEFLYWSGRLAELQGSPERAIRSYVAILMRSPHHLLADAAAGRLAGEALQPSVEPVAQQLAASGRRNDLHAAWLLHGASTSAGRAARSRLLETLESDRRARDYLSIDMVPPRRWPLWNASLTRPEDRLLALGLWAEGESRLTRYFPFSDPALAFSAAVLLGQVGLTRGSLRIVEILAEGAPDTLPKALWPTPFRRRLYPYPFRSMIESHAQHRGIDPALLAGLIREESRFDPQAVSVASARGLTQFVHPTAIEIASSMGLPFSDPAQLHDPSIAIALGAAYLARLVKRFDGRVDAAITAYNAGEDQTRLWRSYCYSRNPAEYYSKVGFAQTRGYLRKVWSSRGQYAELYGGSVRASR